MNTTLKRAAAAARIASESATRGTAAAIAAAEQVSAIAIDLFQAAIDSIIDHERAARAYERRVERLAGELDVLEAGGDAQPAVADAITRYRRRITQLERLARFRRRMADHLYPRRTARMTYLLARAVQADPPLRQRLDSDRWNGTCFECRVYDALPAEDQRALDAECAIIRAAQRIADARREDASVADMRADMRHV